MGLILIMVFVSEFSFAQKITTILYTKTPGNPALSGELKWDK